MTEESYLCRKTGEERFFAKAQNDSAERLMDDMGSGGRVVGDGVLDVPNGRVVLID